MNLRRGPVKLKYDVNVKIKVKEPNFISATRQNNDQPRSQNIVNFIELFAISLPQPRTAECVPHRIGLIGF